MGLGLESCRNIICANDISLLNFLNDKIQSREWLSEFVRVPPFLSSMKGRTSEDVARMLDGAGEMIIQEADSCGGYGTYLIRNEDHFEVGQDRYLVSKYLEMPQSVNIHVIVDRYHVHLFPISIQIIEVIEGRLLFRGSDFFAGGIADPVRDVIFSMAEEIGERLRAIGYRGVAGIDMVISRGAVYVTEINPRFQASTPLLNDSLGEGVSMQLLNYLAFQDVIVDYDYRELKVSESSYIYYSHDDMERLLYKRWQYSGLPGIEIMDDGFDPSADSEELTYMFRVGFHSKIAEVTDYSGQTVLDSVRIDGLHGMFEESPLEYKISILNQGIVIDPDIGREYFREGVFSSIDIRISGLYVNCPVGIQYNELSPFMLTRRSGKFIMTHYGEDIGEAEIFTPERTIAEEMTPNGVAVRDVILLAIDRLRIRYEPRCMFASMGKGCRFCEEDRITRSFDPEDVKSAYDMCRNLDYDHLMIGGGTGASWNKIMAIASYVRSKEPRKQISLMSVPPPRDILPRLKESGITDVSFNIEIFNPDLALEIMPGKGAIPRETYLEILEEAVSVFGRGKVRSMVLLGFDDDSTLYSGVERLCSIGVIPVLSIFRPMPGTPLENRLPPGNQWISDVYRSCESICSRYELFLGPPCDRCQNNVVALPIDNPFCR